MADFLFNLSLNAEREKLTIREHSFNAIPCGVILSTTNLLPVFTISMIVPMVMCSMWFICSKYLFVSAGGDGVVVIGLCHFCF